MEITHQEAHRLIHLNADHSLPAEKSGVLENHMRLCASCKKYSDDLQEMEHILRRSMSRQWNAAPVPISRDHLVRGVKKAKTEAATRFAFATSLFVLISLFVFQNTAPPLQENNSQTPEIIPTPSLTGTNIMALTSPCQKMIPYTIEQKDTLASIALKFSVSESAVREVNQITESGVVAGTRIHIPMCNITPTFSPTGTITITPFFDNSTYTPDS